MKRWLFRIAIALVLLAAMVAALGYHEARQAPIVRRTTLSLPDWPAGARPVTVALIADIHMASATMDEHRLAGIIAQTMALHPDLIVLAGDFIEGRGEAEADRAMPILARRLADLHAPLGVIAVLGNHDHWTDPAGLAATLKRLGVTLLVNQAVARGPLAIGGVDDLSAGHARIGATAAAMRALPGARVMVSHTPDVIKHLPGDVPLLLAGHTHCGQIVLPLIGAPVDVANPRYRCGVVRDPHHVTVVTGGVGTSDVPFRIGAPPDLWLVTLGPGSTR